MKFTALLAALVVALGVAGVASAAVPSPPAHLRAVLVEDGYRYAGGFTTSSGPGYSASPGDHVHARVALRMPSARAAFVAALEAQGMADTRRGYERKLSAAFGKPVRITDARAWQRWLILDVTTR